MSCWNLKYKVTLRGRTINGSDSNDKWYEWLDNIYFKTSKVTQDAVLKKMSAKARGCFNKRIATYRQRKRKNQARCTPTSIYSKVVDRYQKECVRNNPTVQNTLDRFYGAIDNSVANYKSIFDSKRALAESEILEIKTIINSFPKAMSDLNMQVAGKKREVSAIDRQIEMLERKTDAEDQQFVDDKKVAGKTVKKHKLNVLQDYLLAGFFITYFFFGLVAIFYVSKINDYSWKIFGSMTLLVVIVGGLMTAVINYVG